MLLLDDANPVFAAPAAWKVAEALTRVPFIVTFGSFLDDTSALADLVLPDHSFLESWIESQPESGAAKAVATTVGPAMRPLYDTRATPDVLLESRAALSSRSPPLPWQTFEEMLQAPAATAPALGRSRRYGACRPRPGLGRARFDGEAAQYPFHFLPYASQALYDGSLAHLPWLQELPDPMTSRHVVSWVELNEQPPSELGIADGDLVEVTSAQGSVRAPASSRPASGPTRWRCRSGRATRRSRATPAGAAPTRSRSSRAPRWTAPNRSPGRPRA